MSSQLTRLGKELRADIEAHACGGARKAHTELGGAASGPRQAYGETTARLAAVQILSSAL